MAVENAKKFIQMVQDDQALRDRVAGMTPGDRIKAAGELGLDYTEEELTEALKAIELSEDEMEETAGGGSGRVRVRRADFYCEKSPNERHDYVYQGHEEQPHTFLFWDYTQGFDVYACSYCGRIDKRRT